MYWILGTMVRIRTTTTIISPFTAMHQQLEGTSELGNYKNDYLHGPLLEKWPGPGDMRTEFNDYSSGIKNEESIPPDEYVFCS
jgi:hypothetical protein